MIDRFALVSLTVLVLRTAIAEPVSDVRNTKHNLSVSGPGPVRAVTESQVCVFCHTPHGAENVPAAPLWNRQLSGATYTPYTSNSIDATDIAASPGGSSKLCLSCHDGTLAIGSVNVANGQTGVSIAMTGTAPGGTMPHGEGELTGFTRRLGVNLTNDHPISFTYDTSLALQDGELRDPQVVSHIGNRSPGNKPVVPLEGGRMECISCHDPHVRDSDPAKSIKFLRLNRFQQNNPLGGAFDQANDIVCLACHDKMGPTWSRSAHADSAVANETYKPGPAALREFPPNVAVWEASCLNCHDTHTVQGSRRLLREGTDALGSLSMARSGGEPAIESTCYQCHTTAAESILNSSTEVPNIKTDFSLPRHMPIESADQAAGAELHDIADADFLESPANLGNGDLNRRHAECTDCHNPHRVQRNRLFNATGSTVAGTHDHDASEHSNLASGVLRGAWGVEPNYGSTSFQDMPVSYTVKKGDGGDSASTAVISPWVTREYQICLKCHSDYGYADNNVYPTGSRPNLGESGGGTPPSSGNANGLTQYTNQAKEFQAPLTHRGEGTKANSGAGAAFATNNHRSWHPVVDATGRDGVTRNDGRDSIAGNWESPFNRAVGTQTMYCSDCHGSATGAATVVPNGGENGSPWGPHGSQHDFILKGEWSKDTGTGRPNDLCFKCHDYGVYAGGDRSVDSGFGRGDNLHGIHYEKIDEGPEGNRVKCMWCHVAVPHGWKNKGLLVNLNDVGPEAGLPPGTEVPINSSGQVYNQEPYYWNAKLKIRTFAEAGNWRDDNCGSASGTPDVGRDWMKDVCANPP